MSKDPKLTGGHVVKIETVQLESFIDVTGAGDYQVVPFEREIFWVRSAEARVALAFKGKFLKEIATFVDGRAGFLSCVKSALDCALAAADDMRLLPHTATENLVLQVMITTQDTPAVMDRSSKAMHYMDIFKGIAIHELDGAGGEDNSIRIACAGVNNALRDWAALNAPGKPKDYAEISKQYEKIQWLEKNVITNGEVIWSSDTSTDNTFEKAMQKTQAIIDGTPNLISILEEQRQEYLRKIRENH